MIACTLNWQLSPLFLPLFYVHFCFVLNVFLANLNDKMNACCALCDNMNETKPHLDE